MRSMIDGIRIVGGGAGVVVRNNSVGRGSASDITAGDPTILGDNLTID
jgi:hypothetical protein